MSTSDTVSQDVTKVETTVSADAAKVEATVKSDVAAVQTVESGLSRTKLAWAGVAIGFIVGQIVALLFKI